MYNKKLKIKNLLSASHDLYYKTTEARRTCLSVFVVLVFLTISRNSFATTAKKTEPAKFAAESAICQEQQDSNICTYMGNVSFDEGTNHLTAPKVTIMQKNSKINKVIAEGDNSHYTTQIEDGNKTINASAKIITIYPDSKLMVLSGNAEIIEDGNKFNGPYLEYIFK